MEAMISSKLSSISESQEKSFYHEEIENLNGSLMQWYIDIQQRIDWIRKRTFAFFDTAPFDPIPKFSSQSKDASFNEGVAYIMRNDLLGTLIYYLEGNSYLEHLGVFKALYAGHAKTILKLIKLIDLAHKIFNEGHENHKVFLCSYGQYHLRTAILMYCSPEMPSYEAYSMTMHPEKIREANNWMNPHYWCTERVAQHAEMIGCTIISARSLGERLPDTALTTELRLLLGGRLTALIAVRGNTGAGKSQSIGKAQGIINPDRLKALLKNLDGFLLLNKQIHDEGIDLYFRLMRNHVVNLLDLNYILDTRLRMLSDLEEMVIRPAKARGVKAMVFDYDVPLRTSLLRVLLRDVAGDDPCPTLQAIVSGFRDIRSERVKVIRRVKSENTIQRYHLYFQGQEIARKVDGKFTVFNFTDYLKACCPPFDEEIDQVIQQILTAEFIKGAIASGEIPREGKKKLKHWIGVSLGHAVERHAKGEQ